MLDYARQRVIAFLSKPHRAVFVTNGPAGVQASELPCQAVGLDLYLLVPETSDHLFNLEQDRRIILLTAGWELRGVAKVVPLGECDLKLDLLQAPQVEFCSLLRVTPCQVNIRIEGCWGSLETIDFENE